MGLLGAALPRDTQDSGTKIKSPNGIYKAFFIGLTAEYQYVSPFANESCRVCKGKGTGYRDEGQCSVCGGSGRRTEKRTKLRYKLENGAIEEEEVQFKLLPAGTSASGQPLSPTTLFLRLRTLNGNVKATPAELDAWYSSLPQPVKIACTVVIGDNKNGSASKITAVAPRTLGAAAAAPAPATESYDSFMDEPEDEIPF